jgi:hypothetical protein
VPRRSLSGLLVCLLLACGDESAPLEPLRDLPYAAATNSCGPTDAPIVVIYLSAQLIQSLQPVAPFAQVHLPRSFAELTTGVFRIGQSLADANAWFHGSGVETKTATGGEVNVTDVRSSGLAGYVDLVFPDGVRFRGTFASTWQPKQLLCG